MPTIKLKTIQEPAEGTRTVWAFAPGKFVQGDGGDVDLVCGDCGNKLASRIYSSTQLNNIVIKCNACGEFNDTGFPTN